MNIEQMKLVMEVSNMIPDLDKEYEGDILEILEDELNRRNMGLEDFIVRMAKMLNAHTND